MQQEATEGGIQRATARQTFLSKIDRYIMRKFLGTYVFSITLILSIAIIFDINEKINDFLAPEVTLYEIVFHYYLNFVPYYANLFSPLFVFISVIFFTTKLAENSEIIAMLASGLSFKRLLRPYFLASSIIAVATFFLNNYIIPPSTKQRQAFEEKYVRKKKSTYAESVQMEIDPAVFMFIKTYEVTQQTGYEFALERFEGRDLRSRLTAERITFSPETGIWTLHNYRRREFDDTTEQDFVGSSLDTLIRITPDDFLVNPQDAETMTSPMLKEYIARQSQLGVGTAKLFAIELHKRYAAVFSAFILTFIGVVVSAKKVKNGLGINLSIGLLLCSGYILFSTITSTFAISGVLSPLLSAWLPNAVFVLLALLLWRKAPQ